MGFRFQRRLNLTRGMGLNISKSGVSPSLRSRHGSVSTKGFSIRTGIPGLTYRQRFSKGNGGAILMLVLVVVALAPLMLQLLLVAARVLWFLLLWAVRVFIIAPFNLAAWGVQYLHAFIIYRKGQRRVHRIP